MSSIYYNVIMLGHEVFPSLICRHTVELDLCPWYYMMPGVKISGLISYCRKMGEPVHESKNQAETGHTFI